MERINLLTKDKAPEKAQAGLEKITQMFGKIPNIFKVMANSPATLNAFLGIASGLGEQKLDGATAERISLRVAALDGCEYCMAAHSYSASQILSDEEIKLNREGKSSDTKAQAALEFAGSVLKNAGKVSDEEFENIKKAGYSDEEILEIVANVTINFFTNTINNVAHTKVDFPKPKE